MIKRVKQLGSEANIGLISNEAIRSYLTNFESELSRGISTICVLKIILNAGAEGITGYQILKELEEQSKSMLVLEEGRLYPFLKKLEQWKSSTGTVMLIHARKEISGRKKKYYSITADGEKILAHLDGFFSKLLESIDPLLSVKIELQEEQFIYCPNCANRIDLTPENGDKVRFCPMCGLDIDNIRKFQLQGGNPNE